MSNEITVREWQKQFSAGAFDAKDFATQCRAGWYDWFCQDRALAGRLKKIGRVVMGITEPYILDNYYVWFKNNCPVVGGLYDDVRFEPIGGERDGKYFVVSLDCPYESSRWNLFTERFQDLGVAEFGCENIRDMIQYVNNMGHELEQNITPEIVLEGQAVREYLERHHGDINNGRLSRESQCSYTYRYKGTVNGKDIICESSVIAVKDPKNAPPDFDAGKALLIKGFHVYSPQEAEKPVPDRARQAPQKPKSKGQER